MITSVAHRKEEYIPKLICLVVLDVNKHDYNYFRVSVCTSLQPVTLELQNSIFYSPILRKA